MSYDDEIVDRSAPRWAWEIIDETLVMDAQSKAFDAELREQIRKAFDAMIVASENPQRLTRDLDEAHVEIEWLREKLKAARDVE